MAESTLVSPLHIAHEGRCICSMEGESAERQHSVHGSSSPSDHQISFKTSTFHLQRVNETQKGYNGIQPLFLNQVSTPAVAASHFSLLNEGSNGSIPSTAKQQGRDMTSASSTKGVTREDFAVTYSSSGSVQDPGVVPLITVGSVFTLFRKRVWVAPQHVQESAALWQALHQAEDTRDTQWLLDAMLLGGIRTVLGSQAAFQDGKMAFWLTKESAEEAEKSREVFVGPAIASLPDGRPDAGRSRGKHPNRRKEHARPREEDAPIDTVRKGIPRPPLFLLPKHFWVPGASKPPTASQGAPNGENPALGRMKSEAFIVEAPLVRFINMLKANPPRSGFQLEPDQEQSAMDTHAAWQRAQQALRSKNPGGAGTTAGSSDDSIRTGIAQKSAKQEVESSITRGEMPVFRLPGVQIRLPTTVGIVSFSPLFLSKEQLDKTWAAIRAVHWRWLMRERRTERRQLRHNIELVAAGLAGVSAGPALPPPPASASAARPGEEEDEEGMDEPPEVKHFLQELGEGGRPAPEPGLPGDGLPAGGVGFALLSCATGTLSLGMRCIEAVCNQTDRLLSLTPVGRQALGILPDPLVSVHSLGALAERTNAQNTRILCDLINEGAFGEPRDSLAAFGQREASGMDSSSPESAGGEEVPPGLSASSTPKEHIGAAEHNLDQAGGTRGTTGGASSADRSSCTDTVRQEVGLPELRRGNSGGSPEQTEIRPHKRSRLGSLLGKFRRRKPPQPASSSAQLSYSSAGDPPEESPQSSDQFPSDTGQHASSARAELSKTAAAGQEVSEQLEEGATLKPEEGRSISEKSDAAQHAPSTSAASQARADSQSSSKKADAAGHAQSHPASSGADAGAAPEPVDVRLEWPVMNESMMQSLHSFVTEVATALVAQSLGLRVMAVPGLKKHPTQRLRGSKRHQQGQEGSDGGTEGDSTDFVPHQDLDRAMVPFQKSGPGMQEDAAAAEHTLSLGDVEIVFNADKVAGLTLDEDEEENTLKGLIMVGHLNIDPKGREMPWPIPPIGFGNGAHLALADLRCSSNVPRDDAS